MAKLALVLSGAIGGRASPEKAEGEDAIETKSDRELLIEEMNEILAELERREYSRSRRGKRFCRSCRTAICDARE